MAFTTRKSLLAKVREGDEISWSEFYQAYKPLILLCGDDCGLTPEEKEDLVQQVMNEVFQKDIIGKYDPDNVPENVVFKYDPARGRFRHYFRKIIRNQALKIYHKRQTNAAGKNKPCPDAEPAIEVWEQMWDEEWQKHLLAMALTELKGRVQAETYVAFEMYTMQDRPVQEVAKFLSISIASVYTAKSRCISTLKEIVKELEER